MDVLGRRGSIDLVLVDETEIRTLNNTFRHVDSVTDVLSFPSWEGEQQTCPQDGSLGDIAICLSRAEEQAALYGHSLSRELAFLAVHGALHVMGYDHMTPEEELEMRTLQRKILKEMGLDIK